MKVHYINILLFAIPLNILVYNQRNHKSTTHRTPKIKTTRLLCECKLYAPANYDNDPQMKAAMQQFDDRTTQRLLEYDERMKTARQKCKDQCDKEIQKIILKDKLEKALMEKFATLQTDMQSDAIPTCVCEKSMADKVEKGCLRCGGVLGGGVAPSVGLLGGLGTYAWKPGALYAAIKAAMIQGSAKGAAAGLKEGMDVVILGLKYIKVDELFPGIYKTFVAKNIYTEVTKLAPTIVSEYNKICGVGTGSNGPAQCIEFGSNVGMLDETGVAYGNADAIVRSSLGTYVRSATRSAIPRAGEVTATKTAEFEIANVGAVESTYGSCQTAIIASIVAIVIIVLIMVIIYKILRYRRKKKMKKKLQYIKLLEE
ncbi:rifin PIR protein, putative [Plasmodium reichenowi]|uniref:Rifin PIR protein, putative n=1 Tax=Plasmodium reichenowi TaxID=5854 RepID=A0A2P9DBE7_PLARE|nr:rifin PIR protein, putative [Plasmodium reichenowi]